MQNSEIPHPFNSTIIMLALLGIFFILLSMAILITYRRKRIKRNNNIVSCIIFTITVSRIAYFFLSFFFLKFILYIFFFYKGSPINLKHSLLMAERYAPNPQYSACSGAGVAVLHKDSLRFLSEIGEGCFGKVYKGKWKISFILKS